MPKPAGENIVTVVPNWYRAWSLAILSVAVLILSGTVFLFTQSSNTAPSVTVKLTSDKPSYKVGEQITISASFSGADSARVLVSDLHLKYDSSKLELKKADAGPYFSQPMKVKWDLEKGFFTLAKNPGVNTSVRDGSVAMFNFVAKSDVRATDVALDSGTQLYIEDKGGIKPEAKVTLTIDPVGK